MNELYAKLGKLLQLERQRQHIDFADLSDELKISVSNLKAIEAGEADALPSDLYFNLFAKSYAEYLGIDYTRTIEAIQMDIEESADEVESETDKEMGAAAPEDEGHPESVPDKHDTVSGVLLGKRVLILTAAIIALLLIFLGGYALLVDHPAAPGDESQPSNEMTATKQVVSQTGGAAFDFADYNWSVPQLEKPPDLILTLIARQESWAAVLADGDTVIFRNLIPWKRYIVEAKYHLAVSVGIPSQVEITINGQKVDLTDPESGRISGVEINQANVDIFLSRTEHRAATDEAAATVNQAEPNTSDRGDLSEDVPGDSF